MMKDEIKFDVPATLECFSTCCKLIVVSRWRNERTELIKKTGGKTKRGRDFRKKYVEKDENFVRLKQRFPWDCGRKVTVFWG